MRILFCVTGVFLTSFFTMLVEFSTVNLGLEDTISIIYLIDIIDDTMKNYNSLLVHDGSSWSTTSAHGGQDEENSSWA